MSERKERVVFGYVTQLFDEKGRPLIQEFHPEPTTKWQDESGNNIPDPGYEEFPSSFEMYQPEGAVYCGRCTYIMHEDKANEGVCPKCWEELYGKEKEKRD